MVVGVEVLQRRDWKGAVACRLTVFGVWIGVVTECWIEQVGESSSTKAERAMSFTLFNSASCQVLLLKGLRKMSRG